MHIHIFKKAIMRGGKGISRKRREKGKRRGKGKREAGKRGEKGRREKRNKGKRGKGKGERGKGKEEPSQKGKLSFVIRREHVCFTLKINNKFDWEENGKGKERTDKSVI